MKKIFLLLFSLCMITIPAFAASAISSDAMANSCEISALESISSRTAVPGTKLQVRLCQDITLSPHEQLKAGTILTGFVTKVEKGSGWGCPGKLAIQFNFSETSPIQGRLAIHGTPPNFFVQFSLLGIFIKGKNAEITANKNYSLQLLTLKKTAGTTH